MTRLIDFLNFVEPKDKKGNCERCCLSFNGCDQLYDPYRDCEPCLSFYIQTHKCTLEEAMEHSGYLTFDR